LFVSHDRYFISKFATRIWDLNNGKITDHNGTYDEYVLWKQMNSPQTETTKPKNGKRAEHDTKRRVNTKEAERKLKAIEREIAANELEIKRIDAQMEEEASNYERLQELN
jgi:ATP-binding cassette subfamily F protein 3